MKLKIVILVLLIPALTLQAMPTRKPAPSGINSYITGGLSRASFGLLDPSKMTVQHYASMGAQFGGGASLMQSIYTTRIGYQISDPLSLTMFIGLQNNQMGGNLPNQSITMPVGGMTLDWRPRDDMFFRLSVMHMPAYSYRSTPWSLFDNDITAELQQSDLR